MGVDAQLEDVRVCLTRLRDAIEAWSIAPSDDRTIRVVRVSAADLRVALAYLKPHADDPRVIALYTESDRLLARVDTEARV